MVPYTAVLPPAFHFSTQVCTTAVVFQRSHGGSAHILHYTHCQIKKPSEKGALGARTAHLDMITEIPMRSDSPPRSSTIARTRTRLAAVKSDRNLYGSVPATPPAPRVQHSRLYQLLNSSSQAHGSVLFDRALLLLILANVYVDVMLTVDEWAAQHGAAAKVFETVSSLLFIAVESCVEINQ